MPLISAICLICADSRLMYFLGFFLILLGLKFIFLTLRPSSIRKTIQYYTVFCNIASFLEIILQYSVMKKDLKDLSSRFIEAMEYLISTNKVANSAIFAAKVGVSTSMITEIRKGRSNVGTTALQNIVLEFEIDGNWLLTGKGNILREKTSPEQNNNIKEHIEKIAELAGENAVLKERLRQRHFEGRKYKDTEFETDISNYPCSARQDDKEIDKSDK